MDNIVTMAIIKRISDCFDDLANLCLSLAPRRVLRVIQLSSFHVLHHNVKEISVIINFIDLYNIWMFQLSRIYFTENIISHSFLYTLRSSELILFLKQEGRTCQCT